MINPNDPQGGELIVVLSPWSRARSKHVAPTKALGDMGMTGLVSWGIFYDLDDMIW